jgi:CubicO group peptidase (beta-lactamase class C family)
MIAHSKDSLHDIRSITKSFTSACIGIAIKQGKIKSVDQKIFEFFPEYERQDTGLKSTLTIKHLLTMSSGLSWNEDTASYDDLANSEVQMIKSPDPVGFVLSQPMAALPGKVWNYNGGTTQLLAAIIEKATGLKIETFAKQYLFDPLEIKNFTWEKFPGKELTKGFSGLRITSRDLLKFGLLYYQHGKWNNKQILPSDWIDESFQSHIMRQQTKGRAYGYQFWIWNDNLNNNPARFVTAIGNGDQRIYIDKMNNLVIVVTAGNYYRLDIKKNSYDILKDYIYPALLKKAD